jgi:hypothetical protein
MPSRRIRKRLTVMWVGLIGYYGLIAFSVVAHRGAMAGGAKNPF